MLRDVAGSEELSVLVVEDHADEAFLVTEALAGSGFCNVVVAATAAEALDELERRTPDLIILDLGLPDADGLDILHVIRHGGRLGVPVVVVTGDANPERRVRALELGASDVVLKPFDMLELGARALHAVRNHETLEAADVVARTLAKELTELSIELDENTRATADVLLSALDARSPVLGAHARRVGKLVQQLAEAVGLDDVAEHLGVAASFHQIGAITLDDATLAALITGDAAAERACAAATAMMLHTHHRLAIAASRFGEPSAAFEQPVDRLVAQLTAVCHTFDEGRHSLASPVSDRGLMALQAGLDRGLDVDLVRCFVEAGLADQPD